MTAKQPPQADDLRMKSDDFDRVMRGALGVPAPVEAAKPKPKAKKPAATATPRKTVKR
ncbi:hypothetical protein [Diaphorobacter nitroreducens]|uniref:hypothetical protein n=1 Tax=Diaphorobacter nitroreducens TaxID=164759 RepID=UPI0028A1D3B6|nr:hypothetical protein [Diaphorobacter nitroreducens]